MLVIRHSQLLALEQDRQRRFAARVADHLRRYLQPETAHLSDPELHKFAAAAIQRGTAYGLETEPDLCKFCTLAVIFGARFDEDLPFASRILADPSVPSATQRIMRVFQHCIKRLRVEEQNRQILEAAGVSASPA